MTCCYIKLENKILECDIGIVRSTGIARVEKFSVPASNQAFVGKFWNKSEDINSEKSLEHLLVKRIYGNTKSLIVA